MAVTKNLVNIGDAQITGNLEANKLVKRGGTNKQILLADGTTNNMGTSTTQYLRNDGTWAVPTNTTSVTVSITGNGNAFTGMTSSGGLITVSMDTSFASIQNLEDTEYVFSSHVNQLYDDMENILNVNISTVNSSMPLLSIITTSIHNGSLHEVVYDSGISINPYLHSVTEGYHTEASGSYLVDGVGYIGCGHAEGYETHATESGAHTEGWFTTASGRTAHAEGFNTIAFKEAAHAEGKYTQSRKTAAHAEGRGSTADGEAAHAEGLESHAYESASHAEGKNTYAYGNASHAEGVNTTAESQASHAEGIYTYADGIGSHAEGKGSETYANYAHAEGENTCAEGIFSHAEGKGSYTSGSGTHAEGMSTSANGDYTHAEGKDSSSNGMATHAEGRGTRAEGDSTHAEGHCTIANSSYSHAEGWGSYSNGLASHAEGRATNASGKGSHAEGWRTIASGNHSHAEGFRTESSGMYSHASGIGTIADVSVMTAIGKYNRNDNTNNQLFAIGNGTSTSSRSNAFTIYDYERNSQGIQSTIMQIGDYKFNIVDNLNNRSSYIQLSNSTDTRTSNFEVETTSITLTATNNIDMFANNLNVEITDNGQVDITGDVNIDGEITLTKKVSAETGFFQTSDITKKNVIGDISLEKAYELVDKCHTIIYTLKDDINNKKQIGMIAQEVKEYFPEIISEDSDGLLSLDYTKLTIVILKVLKDLIRRISLLEEK